MVWWLINPYIVYSYALGFLAFTSAKKDKQGDAAQLVKRQMNASSLCSTFGLDYQEGGSYFINTNSNDNFTFVSTFSDCNNDLADVMLVNKNTTNQYACGTLSTVPDNTPELSTCEIRKRQLVSGTYLIITVGNNGNGNPFAYQRQFIIDAGPQVNVTVYPKATVTSTPIVTSTSTSTINSTSTIPNPTTVTEPGSTYVQTITPQEICATHSQVITHTFNRWTKSDSIVTATATPTCRLLPRPRHPDPVCTYKPRRDWPMPKNLEQQQQQQQPETGPKGPGHCNDVGCKRPLKRSVRHHLRKRAPDPRTTTVTGSSHFNGTVTSTAPASTQTQIIAATATFTTTAPPHTEHQGQAVRTVTASAPAYTVTSVYYTRKYTTQTFVWEWTSTVVSTPAAEATRCRREGGVLVV